MAKVIKEKHIDFFMKVFVSRGRRNKNLSSTDPDTTIWLSLGNFFKSHKTKQLKRKNNYISFFSFPYFLSNQPKDKARFGWKKKIVSHCFNIQDPKKHQPYSHTAIYLG
jgi:hypothetical protein